MPWPKPIQNQTPSKCEACLVVLCAAPHDFLAALALTHNIHITYMYIRTHISMLKSWSFEWYSTVIFQPGGGISEANRRFQFLRNDFACHIVDIFWAVLTTLYHATPLQLWFWTQYRCFALCMLSHQAMPRLNWNTWLRFKLWTLVFYCA